MDGGAVQIKISDTGIGMSPDQLRRAFEPYGRFESPGGGKLSLPIARALIELHGGLLTLNSEIGMGTNAIIRLPRQRSIRAGNYDTP
jgi:signal transduction histidine kinase